MPPRFLICLRLLFAFAVLFSSDRFASADIIADIDFEGTNDPAFFSGYSDGGNLNLDVTTDSPNGNGATEGAEIEIVGITGSPASGGGAMGLFDLTGDSRFVLGSIAAAQLDLITVSFDVEVIGPATGEFYLEVSTPTGDAANRVELTPTVSGSYQSLSFDLASLDATEKSAMAGSFNLHGTTHFNLGFNFAQSGGAFVVGNSIRMDNLLIETTAVPEPGHFIAFVLLGIGITVRRRRST